MTSELNIEKVEGEGPPLVFIHGWMGSKKAWKNVRESLELENPLIFYDQRCHGESPCSEFSIEDLARDLEDITEELDEPVLVGHSMGGMSALKYSTLSENFSALLLLATSASTPETDYSSPKFLLNQISGAAKEKITEILSDTEEEDEDTRKNTLTDIDLKDIIEIDRKPLIYGFNAMKDYDIREDLENERVLVVAGEKDRIIPHEQSEKVAKLLKCEFMLIDSSHHMLQEKPEKIAEITQKFLRKL